MAINLANQTGREGKLSAAYRDAADRFSAAFGGFRLVPFDFHKQCGATNYARWATASEAGLGVAAAAVVGGWAVTVDTGEHTH